MAKPIKETPILRGKDAVNFFQNMKEAQNTKVSSADLDRIRQNANRMKSIFQK